MAWIGKVRVGRGSGPKIMGVINASPESFYKQSVRASEQEISFAASQMQQDGAQIIDIGAMSTAPYLDTLVSEEEETRRMVMAVEAVKDACSIPISADTPRSNVAKAAINAGAIAINDVTGLKYDGEMANQIAKTGSTVIACAYSNRVQRGALQSTIRLLKESITIAERAGIDKDRLLIDPSIGFFRNTGTGPFFTRMTDMPWYSRDLEALKGLGRLAQLAPICIAVSAKSFIGHLLNISEPEKRVAASIACEIYAAINGASVIRTHNVKATVEALTMLQLL